MEKKRTLGASGHFRPAGVDVVLEALKAPLEARGLRRRRAHLYTINIHDGVVGVVAIGYVTTFREPWVVTPRPEVGVYHQAVERIVAELQGQKNNPCTRPTILRSLGEMAGQGLLDTEWQCGPSRIAEPTGAVVAARPSDRAGDRADRRRQDVFALCLGACRLPAPVPRHVSPGAPPLGRGGGRENDRTVAALAPAPAAVGPPSLGRLGPESVYGGGEPRPLRGVGRPVPGARHGDRRAGARHPVAESVPRRHGRGSDSRPVGAPSRPPPVNRRVHAQGLGNRQPVRYNRPNPYRVVVDRFRFAWSTIFERGGPPFPIPLVDSTELHSRHRSGGGNAST